MKTIIFGNGSMAKVLFSYARHSHDIAGFTVDSSCIQGDSTTFLGKPLVPFETVQTVFKPSEHNLLIAVGFLEMNMLREKKYIEAKQKGYTFTSYVHNSLIMHDDVTIGENCIILEYVSIHPGSQIGKNTFISSNVGIGHDCSVGPANWINSGVSIAGGCAIGPGCFFGVNASVGHDVQVGAYNFVAANTLLVKKTEDHAVYLSESGTQFPLKSRAFLKFIRERS
jgi:sugar O-acyltransferase (sialic acid O-acetyltransferase NeuD family)